MTHDLVGSGSGEGDRPRLLAILLLLAKVVHLLAGWDSGLSLHFAETFFILRSRGTTRLFPAGVQKSERRKGLLLLAALDRE